MRLSIPISQELNYYITRKLATLNRHRSRQERLDKAKVGRMLLEAWVNKCEGDYHVPECKCRRTNGRS